MWQSLSKSSNSAVMLSVSIAKAMRFFMLCLFCKITDYLLFTLYNVLLVLLLFCVGETNQIYLLSGACEGRI